LCEILIIGVCRSSIGHIQELETYSLPQGVSSASALFSQQSSSSWLRRVVVAIKSASLRAAALQLTLGGVAEAAVGVAVAAARRGGYPCQGVRMGEGLQTEADAEGAGVVLRARLQRGLSTC
jgi:hypothetical protein